MKLFPIVTAVVVCVALYFILLDRQALVDFAARFGGGDDADMAAMADATVEDTATAGSGAATLADEVPGAVHVVARRSTASVAENAVLLRGRTEALRQVDVQAETTGRIISDPIRAGAFVEQGQLLCRIDPGTRAAALAEAEARLLEARARLPEAMAQLPVARARLAEAEASLTAARIDGNAASRLSESGFASETRAASAAAAVSAAEAVIESATAGVQAAEAGIQSAQSGIRAAEAVVLRAEEDIGRLNIHAPFAGHLESDTAELGALMQTGAHCATVIQLDPIKLVGFVPEAQVDRVKTGAPAGARLATGADVRGNVVFLSRSADPQTRTFRVEIEVDNPDLAIRDGQTADILISAAGTPAHLLPGSALTLDDTGVLGVRIATEDSVAQFMAVSMLRDTPRGVLLAGLPDQVDVITVGQEFVTDGVPVHVTYEEPTQ
ncbi:MAG: efflux RND transporter periplasmic adaptor subunit [Rhodobacteraceae bacterium]|nr:efflux RND transporter periplasmic adaptor subunit [Paracoccaceae bacterium]